LLSQINRRKPAKLWIIKLERFNNESIPDGGSQSSRFDTLNIRPSGNATAPRERGHHECVQIPAWR
jgi:hypothetical protein